MDDPAVAAEDPDAALLLLAPHGVAAVRGGWPSREGPGASADAVRLVCTDDSREKHGDQADHVAQVSTPAAGRRNPDSAEDSETLRGSVEECRTSQ